MMESVKHADETIQRLGRDWRGLVRLDELGQGSLELLRGKVGARLLGGCGLWLVCLMVGCLGRLW